LLLRQEFLRERHIAARHLLHARWPTLQQLHATLPQQAADPRLPATAPDQLALWRARRSKQRPTAPHALAPAPLLVLRVSVQACPAALHLAARRDGSIPTAELQVAHELDRRSIVRPCLERVLVGQERVAAPEWGAPIQRFKRERSSAPLQRTAGGPGPFSRFLFSFSSTWQSSVTYLLWFKIRTKSKTEQNSNRKNFKIEWFLKTNNFQILRTNLKNERFLRTYNSKLNKFQIQKSPN
jgi:hypothetical protein